MKMESVIEREEFAAAEYSSFGDPDEEAVLEMMNPSKVVLILAIYRTKYPDQSELFTRLNFDRIQPDTSVQISEGTIHVQKAP